MPRSMPLWFLLFIESQSYCNLRCPNCMRNTEPAKSRFRDREPIRERMPTGKVHDFIDQAAEMGYRGLVGFNYYNEPTCEPRLVSFAKYAKRRGMLPWVASNGVLLTDDLCKHLDGVIDRIDIGFANTSEAGRKKSRVFWQARFPNVRNLVVAAKGDKPDSWSPTHFFPQRERLQAAIRRNIKTPCHIPRKWFIIQYNGEMSLCCDDLSHNFSLGNAFEESLEDLWWSERHIEILKTLSVAGGRLKYPYCRICPASDFDIEANYRAWYAGSPYLSVRPRYG